jgi:hypothetical protein
LGLWKKADEQQFSGHFRAAQPGSKGQAQNATTIALPLPLFTSFVHALYRMKAVQTRAETAATRQSPTAPKNTSAVAFAPAAGVNVTEPRGSHLTVGRDREAVRSALITLIEKKINSMGGNKPPRS